MKEILENESKAHMGEATTSIIKSYKITLILGAFLLLIIGFLCGWLGFLMCGDIAKSCQVLVISKEALIAAEEERIKHLGNSLNSSNNNNSNNIANSDNSIFFGKSEEALIGMEKIAQSFENKRTKVLFISSSSGAVKNGIAITDTVHKELIKILKPKS